jgi:hypothetical protein
MLPRTFRECRQVSSNFSGAETQRVYLKTTALDLRYDFSFSSQLSYDFNALISDNERHELIVNRRVLDQSAFGAERSLNPVD